MPDKKISELDAITGSATAADDFFIVVDSSGASTNKISRAELNNAIEQDVLENISITNLTSDLNTNGNDINFGDNDKATFGASSDLQVYHDGLNSYVRDVGTGDLYLQGSNNVQIESAAGANMIYATAGAQVRLFYDGSPKFNTTSSGIDVQGSVTADGLTVDGDATLEKSGGATLTLTDTTDAAIGGETIGVVKFLSADDSAGNCPALIKGYNDDQFGRVGLALQTGSSGTSLNRLTIGASTGDISFYDSTGVTQGFFWDADQQRLGLGETSPSKELHVKNFGGANVVSDYQILIEGNSAGYGAGVSFQSQITGGSLAEMARITADGESAWNTTASTQDAGLRFFTSLDGTVSERLRIDSDGNVGIGTGSPSESLTNRGNIFIETNSTSADSGNGLFWQSTTSGWTTSTAHAAIYGKRIDASNGYLRFDTRQSGTTQEAMRLDASGNLLVGKTAAATNVEGGELRENGQVIAVATNVNPFFGARLGSDGDLAVFRKDSTTVGSIGIQASGFYIDGESGHEGMRFANGAITPRENGSDSDGTSDLGATNNRFKDLYLSGGVYLGGTGSANLLDDYEEGTFTPSLIGHSGGEATYAIRSGAYTKVGRLVTCQINMTISSPNTMSGNAQINDLPFTVADVLSGTSIEANGTVGYLAGLNNAYSSMSCYALSGTTNAEFSGIYGTSATAYSSLNTSDITSSFAFRVTISYFTT